jgi:hypothetical protein
MDQDSAKKGFSTAHTTWRDKLGIKRELPKISGEFAAPNRASAPERREPSLVSTQVRPAIKPAPMAPRVAAPKPAPQVTANTELAERIRQQRQAAERMAEQRIAEAKQRAVDPPPPPVGPVQESPSAKPRFSFAEEELRQARQEPAKGQPVPGRWHQMPPQRPMFSAERYGSTAASDPRSGAPPVGQRPAISPMPAGPSARIPPPPRRAAMPPPQPMPPAGESGWHAQGTARPRPNPPPPVFDPYRRDVPSPRGFGHADPYADQNAYRAERSRADAIRDPTDYRGAHARELSGVEDQGDDLFEDEQAPPPRRAEARDYNQAFREYEVSYPEQPRRRRLGPFLLLLALLAVAVVAIASVYWYHKTGAGPLIAKGEDPLPVVTGDSQPVKAEPEAAAEIDEASPSKPSGEQQVSAVPSAQRKQIYDRILGETTLEEQEQLAPGEEQPVRPSAEDPAATPSPDTQTNAASGQALDAEPPLPLPLPPPPGGSADDETGGLDLTGQPQKRVSNTELPVAAASDSDGGSPTPASTAPDVQPSPTSASDTAPAKPSATTRVAAAEGSETILSDNDPQQDLIVSGGPAAASTQSPEPDPPLTGSGPIQIAPQQLGTSQVDPGFAVVPPSVPNATTTIRKSKVGSRGSKSADNTGISVSSSNFNRQAAPQQVAAVEPGLLDTEVAAEPAPQAPQVPEQQQAALPPPSEPAPAPSEPTKASGGEGFVMLFSSHRSEAEALAEFDRLRQRHAGLVGSLTPGVRKINLGSSGTRYQLSVGVIPTRDAAKSLCSSLFAAGEKDCIVRPR